MAKKVEKSFLSGVGSKAKKAFKTHKADPVQLQAGAELPENVNGVAQLKDIGFGKYKSGTNKGKLYFLARATVKEPAEFANYTTQRGPIPLCDAGTKTEEEMWAIVINEFKKLGVATEDLSDPEELELEICPALLEDPPYIRFRTWKGRKQTKGPYKDREPLVQHDWRGIDPEYTESEEEDEVEDDTEEVEVEDDEEVEDEEGSEIYEEDEVDEEEPEDDEEEDDEEEYDEEEYEDEDEEEADEDEEEYEEDEEDEEDEEEVEVTPPQLKELVWWKRPRARKYGEYEVIKVNKTKETCSLKSVDTGERYHDIGWDEVHDDNPE